MIGRINNYIQRRMQKENMKEVALTTAARWLDEENILKDSQSSPGYVLRRHVHRGNIFDAFKKNNYFWYIRRIDDYKEILTPEELTDLFGLKNKKSIYRKVKLENIPFKRFNRKGIYFEAAELLRWTIESNRVDLFEKIQKRISGEQHLS